MYLKNMNLNNLIPYKILIKIIKKNNLPNK